jgi:signal transduction histidine kinase
MDMAHPEDKQIVANLMDELYRNGNVTAEYRIVRPDGKVTWLYEGVSIIYDENGSPIMMGGIAKDVTEQKELQLKLQGIISAKDIVLSIIAHDLKSPFNSFIGFTEILANENNTITDEVRLSYINLLHDSAVSTYKLLDNLLDWSRLHLGSYEIHKENIFLKYIIDDCVELYTSTSENKKISVINQVSDKIEAYIDGNSIKTILRNLLNNALKYTPEGGLITFSSTHKQNFIEITVQDTGVGLKPEMLKKIFSMGENTSTPGTKMEKGTGIGLVLCKELLDKNGGTLQIESEFGKGSTFTLRLPHKSMEVYLPN